MKLLNPIRLVPILSLMIIQAGLFSAAWAAEAYPRETPVVRAVRLVSPAVVNISSEYEVQRRPNPFSGFGMDPLVERFFRDFFDPGAERPLKRTSLGSGVIIDGEKGFVLTNAHVIERAGTITVVLRDEREFEAQIIGADPQSDLAVLRIQSTGSLPAITMGESDDLMIGETVIAIGNPFGFSHTVTTGVISALNRSIRTDDRVYHNFIQIDASINPGNSGGPLLNINGELIGINTAIYAKAQGIGFAIPINMARRIVTDLIQYGEVKQAWIGMVLQDLDAGLAHYLGLPNDSGTLVKRIEPDSPAEKAGVQSGDILMAVGKSRIESREDYQQIIRRYAPGNRVRFHLRRDDETLSVTVTASIFPMDRADELADRMLGISVEDPATVYGRSGAARDGVVITEIRRDCYLARIGVRPGDVIRQIDEISVTSKAEFDKALIRYRNKNSVVILLQRGDQGYYITVEI